MNPTQSTLSPYVLLQNSVSRAIYCHLWAASTCETLGMCHCISNFRASSIFLFFTGAKCSFRWAALKLEAEADIRVTRCRNGMVTHPQCHNENQLPLPSKIETEKLCRFRRSVPILNKLRYGFISHICDRDTFMLSFWMRHCVGLEGVGNYTHSLWQRYGMATACSCTRQLRRAAEDP